MLPPQLGVFFNGRLRDAIPTRVLNHIRPSEQLPVATIIVGSLGDPLRVLGREP